MVLHAAVLWPLALGVLWGARREWSHLFVALGQPVHAGPPPGVAILLASLLALLGGGTLVVAVVRRRGAPLWASGLVLAAVTLSVLSPGPEAALAREAPIADRLLGRCAARVQKSVDAQLQDTGDVPLPERWPDVVAEVCPDDLLRDRAFRPRRPPLVFVEEQVFPDAPPGTLVVFISPDRARFALYPVGFSHDPTPEWLGGRFRPDIGLPLGR